MNKRPTLDSHDAVRALCSKVIGAAIDDAIALVEIYQRNYRGMSDIGGTTKSLIALDRFFKTSCFMWELDYEGLISDIRKYLYPDLPPEERIKIPLKLTELYKGVEVRKAWKKKLTQQKS